MNSSPRSERPASLLDSLQSLLERTYRMDTGIKDVSPYVIGDQGYRYLYGESTPGTVHRAGSAGAGARVLVRHENGAVSARIYYPDVLIRSLEERPPSLGVGPENIDAFATFIEELDHFLLVAERARLERPVSLLELEMHANVTKYLVCALYVGARNGGRLRPRLDPEARLWLLWHLFEKSDFAEQDPEVQTRYRDASRFARRFLGLLDRDPDASCRLSRLRAFHDATHQQKLAILS